jgi:hypothetical protein
MERAASTQRHGAVLVASALAVSLAPAVARAGDGAAPQVASPVEPQAPFGTAGQWVVSGSSDIGLQLSTFGGSSASRFSATFSPGVDYFVARNLAVGLTLDFTYSFDKGYGADSSLVDTIATTGSGGVRMAYNIPFGRRFSLYPRLALGAEALHNEQRLESGSTLSIGASPLGATSTTQIGPWVEVYVPLLWQLAPHFFVGAGPSFYRDFGNVQGDPSGTGQRTEIELGFVVGGTWGGAESVPDTAAPAPAPAIEEGAEPLPGRRFGDAHEVVLDSEILAETYLQTYSGTSSTSAGVSFEPSFDYFVSDGISVGVAPAVSYGKTTGIDSSTGAAVTSVTWGYAVEPRLGFVAHLSPLFSFYPRFGLVVGGESYDETEGSSQNTSSSVLVAVHIFAPLLVHPASHLFVGLGPSFYSELSDAVHYPDGASTQNRETTFGLALIVGGWL